MAIMPRSRRPFAAATFCAASAAVVAVLAFVPWPEWLPTGQPDENAHYYQVVLTWVWWAVLAVPIALLLARRWGVAIDGVFERGLQRVAELPVIGYATTLAVIFGVAAALLSNALFSHNPHITDTIAQLFQAKIFAGGSLTAPAPEQIEFFGASHLVAHEGRWFSQYPPGHPGMLVLGVIAGVPWLVNPLVAAATLVLLYGVARRLLGEMDAKLAAALLVLSPFALFMSASYMNHVTHGFFLVLALYAAVRAAEEERGIGWPLLLGCALGLAATIRPLESAVWAGVLGVWLLLRRGWKPALGAGVACLTALSPLLVYNALTTGHPLRFGYMVLWGPGHGLGFHTDPWGEPFTPVRALGATALDFQRLNVSLFEWPFPSLIFVLIALALAFKGRSNGAATWLAALLLAAPIAYFFYWHRDGYLGPRFLYSSLGPLILLSAAGVVALDIRLGRWRSALRLLLIAGVLVVVGWKVPERVGSIAGQLQSRKLHPENEARRAGIDQALVFVKVGWGSRLMARLWAWGISASEAEQSYRVVDGCRLQSALDEADSLAAAGGDSLAIQASLAKKLQEFRILELPVARDLLADRTVRVDTTRVLAEACREQILRDAAGFTVYGTLVWRNDPWLREGIIFARDFGPERNQRLMQRYPGWEYYIYAPLSGELGEQPVLRPLRSSESPSESTSQVDRPRLGRGG